MVKGSGSKAKATKKTTAANKAPRRPYSRFTKRQHAALVRARYNIVSARSKEVDNFVNELLKHEMATNAKIAMLQAANHGRTQVTAEDMAYALETSGTLLKVAM